MSLKLKSSFYYPNNLKHSNYPGSDSHATIIPVATAAFKDSALPFFGIVTGWVIFERKDLRMPFDSLPTTSNPSLAFATE